MKKSTTILYLALVLGILVVSCTPCDDGDADSNAVAMNQTQIDSINID